MTRNSSKKPTSKKMVTKKPPKSGTPKSPTKGSNNKTKESGVTPTSETVRIDPFRKPKPRKGKKGTRHWLYYWYEQQIMRLPKGKLKTDFQNWLIDPENGLIW